MRLPAVVCGVFLGRGRLGMSLSSCLVKPHMIRVVL